MDAPRHAGTPSHDQLTMASRAIDSGTGYFRFTPTNLPTAETGE